MKITDEALNKLLWEKQSIIKRLDELDDLIRDKRDVYKNKMEVKMADDTPIEQPAAVVKLTIAERSTKTLEMLKAGKKIKDVMKALNVSYAYVYNKQKEIGK